MVSRIRGLFGGIGIWMVMAVLLITLAPIGCGGGSDEADGGGRHRGRGRDRGDEVSGDETRGTEDENIDLADEGAAGDEEAGADEAGSGGSLYDADGRLNINLATSSQLQELNGIGQTTADNIIAYREENGPFRSVEELDNVSRIGPALIERISDDVFVEGGSSAAPTIEERGDFEDVTAPATQEGVEGEPAAPAPRASSSNLINVNTATAAELDRLPRIGPSKAQAIIDYREENGPFASVDDLTNVSGIGPATVDAFRDQATAE